MDFQDCVEFASKNPICHVATAEGDQPKLRAVIMWFADKTGFYFQTQTVKALWKQLQNNKKVALYFRDPEGAEPAGIGKVMRVTGEVEILEDMKFKVKAIEEREILKILGITKPDDPLLALFRVYTGEVYFWTMRDNMRESEIERIKF